MAVRDLSDRQDDRETSRKKSAGGATRTLPRDPRPFMSRSKRPSLGPLILAGGLLLGGMVWLSTSRRGPESAPLPVIRQLSEFRLTNQLGAAVNLDSVRGHPGVFNVVFSRCPGQCHRLSILMSRLQTNLPPGVRLWSLTADPAFDTPEVLDRYGRRYGASPERWQFLTGSKVEVYRVATKDLLFSVLENPDPAQASLEDLFIHSGALAVVDAAARLRGVVQSEAPDAVAQVERLLAGLERERP